MPTDEPGVVKNRRPRNQDLPEMSDRAIKPLQSAAEEYAEIRDARIELNVREGKLKKRLRDLMHKYERVHYAYEGVEIQLLPPDGEEQVKVKVKKAGAAKDEEDTEIADV